MSGGICVWMETRFPGTWKTMCGGRVKETPREGKACPWCGCRVVVDDGEKP